MPTATELGSRARIRAQAAFRMGTLPCPHCSTSHRSYACFTDASRTELCPFCSSCTQHDTCHRPGSQKTFDCTPERFHWKIPQRWEGKVPLPPAWGKWLCHPNHQSPGDHGPGNLLMCMICSRPVVHGHSWGPFLSTVAVGGTHSPPCSWP